MSVSLLLPADCSTADLATHLRDRGRYPVAIRPLGAIVVGSGWIGCSVRVSGDRVTIQPMIPGMREILAWIALVCAVGAGIVAWFLVLAPRCERVQRELERLLRRELGARTER